MSDHNPPPPRRPPPYPPEHWSDSDTFMINLYKFKHCPFPNMVHDFAECPYTHVGDVYRRDYRYHNHEYCRENVVQNGKCHRGDQCQNAHGFYEYNYHPSRYRTMPCIHFGTNDCPVSGCSFYHFGYQQRPVTQNYVSDPAEREGPPVPPPRPDGNNPILGPLVYQFVPVQIPSFHQVMPPLQLSFLPDSAPGSNVIFSPVPPPRNMLFWPYSSPGVTFIRPSPGVNIFLESSSTEPSIFRECSSTPAAVIRPNSATPEASYRPSSPTSEDSFRPISATPESSYRPRSPTSEASRPRSPTSEASRPRSPTSEASRPNSPTSEASLRPLPATSATPVQPTSSTTDDASTVPVPRPPEEGQ